MNRFKIVVVVLINLILQSTLFSRIDVLSVHANISIPVVVSLAIGFGPYVGGFGGLIIGLIEDILFSKVLGIRALMYFIIGFLIGNSEAGINKEDIRTGIILTAVSTVGNFLGNSIIIKIIGDKVSILSYLLGPIFIEVILNSLLYILVFYLFKKIFEFPRFRL
ncbi:rod shape-determining protein MreD [Miniphocaeibacter halophilus]|uniref:Rod shape-determining protein MreD n=1 Tax=Miniphocaeibacter halophilus TaxID=2931922 RepID=A0AC61MNN2_9FIRM|nr:rod shape-determining protein MreD [Miniphocaeibacter halophilus]QQK07152.1 rod shape-determining protein MreD [Miniphocaeibacter halophilus]